MHAYAMVAPVAGEQGMGAAPPFSGSQKGETSPGAWLPCRFPGSMVLATFRAQAVMLQGIWFIQIAQILFKGVQPLPAQP